MSAENDSLMQIPDEIRKSVAFLCFRTNEGISLAGTVFFVVVGSQGVGHSFGYAVTAKHVIVNIQRNSVDGKVLIRMNMLSGPSRFIEVHSADWKFHPDDPSVDVAVLPFGMPPDTADFRAIPIEMAATDEVIQSDEIGVGDEVFLTGLFDIGLTQLNKISQAENHTVPVQNYPQLRKSYVNHHGRERNLPIIRNGNIALMPEEPVQTRDLGPIDAYLVEARSIGGLSGSPVFVHFGAARFIDGRLRTSLGGPKFYWLGLMHGHFHAPLPGQDSSIEDLFSQEYVNMGIAIVIPVHKILEVINQESLVRARQQKNDELQKGTLPIPDTISVDPQS
jgi:hypothetical protein